MEKLTYKIAAFLAETGHIPKADTELCRYGIELFIISVFEIAAVLVLSLFVGNFKETVLFLLSFLPVRIYAGGYHADTRIKCFLILIFVYILFSVVLYNEFLMRYQYCMSAAAALNMLCVFFWAPVSGKKMTEREQKFYRRIGIAFASAELLIIAASCLFGFYGRYIYIAALGAFTALASLAAAKLKNVLRGRLSARG